MPQVPYTGAQSVSPNYPATPTVHPNANPEAFGAATAAASARFGVSLQQAAGSIFDRAIAMQEMDQQADALNASALTSDKVAAAKLDYMTKSGKAAYDGYEPFASQVDKIIEDGAVGLKSDFARQHYISETRQMRRYVLDHAASHAAGEFKNYQVGTEQAKADSDINAIGLNPVDNDYFQGRLDSLRARADTLASIRGESKEWADDKYNELTNKAVQVRVKALAADGKIPDAQRALDSARQKGLVSGEIGGLVQEYIRTQTREVVLRNEVPAMLEGDRFKVGMGKVPKQALFKAIIGVESAGNYEIRGKAITDPKSRYYGQRALGIGQVMPGNLKSWLKEAEMPDMTEDEYLKDHAAQDKLVMFKLDQLQTKLGSANAAAVAWRGPGAVDKTLGETKEAYLRKFNGKLARELGDSHIEEIADRRAKELIPDDTRFHEDFKQQAVTINNRRQAIEREAELDRFDTVNNAIMTPGPNGKYPIEITDPKVKEAYDQLLPENQLKVNQNMANNATKVYAKTVANQQERDRWIGALVNPAASKEDREEAYNKDFWSMDLPIDQRKELVNLRKKIFKGDKTNPGYGMALRIATPLIAPLHLSKDETNRFNGALYRIMEEQMEDGQPVKPEKVREITNAMIQEKALSDKGLFGVREGDFLTPLFGPARGKVFMREVPDNMRKQIVDTYKAQHNGIEPSEEDIISMHNAILYRSMQSNNGAQ